MCMYIYIYIYIHIHIHIHIVYTHLSLYIYIYVYRYVYIYILVVAPVREVSSPQPGGDEEERQRRYYILCTVDYMLYNIYYVLNVCYTLDTIYCILIYHIICRKRRERESDVTRRTAWGWWSGKKDMMTREGMRGGEHCLNADKWGQH